MELMLFSNNSWVLLTSAFLVDKMLGSLVGRKILEVSSEKSFSHLTSRSVDIKIDIKIEFIWNYVFQEPSLPVCDGTTGN